MNIRPFAVLLALALPPVAASAQDYRHEVGETFGSPVTPFVTIRTGIWSSKDFEFSASSVKGTRDIKGGAFVDMGAEMGVILYNDFTISGSFDSGLSKDAQIGVLGVNAGYSFPFESLGIFGAPVRTRVSVGALFGDMSVKDFSDFDKGTGYRAGLDFVIDIPDSKISIDTFIDYRFIELDLKEDVTSGDDHFGGGSLFLGVGIQLRV